MLILEDMEQTPQVSETETPHNQGGNRNPDGTFPPGVSGNPAGRPKGQTLKEFAREYYLAKSPEEKQAYIDKMEEKRPGFAWEMAEGKAKQDLDLKGEIVSKVISVDE